MSRIGKAPISLPAKVEVSVNNSNVVSVSGPLGKLTQQIDPDLKLAIEDGTLTLSRPTDQKRHRSVHGLYRSLIANMVEGVSTGWAKEMELIGVGYRADNQGQLLTLSLGYSHPVIFALPEEVKIETVSKEIETYKELDILQKPVDIYLKHCREYAAQYLQRNTIRIADYQFSRRDMHHRTITNKFHDIFEL